MVGQARKRVERVGERTVPFGLRCRTLALSRCALDGDPTGYSERRHRRTAPYRQIRAPSFADMRCELSRAEFAHNSSATPPAKNHARRSSR